MNPHGSLRQGAVPLHDLRHAVHLTSIIFRLSRRSYLQSFLAPWCRQALRFLTLLSPIPRLIRRHIQLCCVTNYIKVKLTYVILLFHLVMILCVTPSLGDLISTIPSLVNLDNKHILIHLLKADILSQSDSETLLSCHTMFLHLYTMLQWSTNIDFSSLGQPIEHYCSQERISTTWVQHFLAAALFYDLDLSTVIRSLRGTYTGGFRHASMILASLHNTGCDAALITDVSRTLLVGCPNKMTASSTNKKILKFFRHGNHTSITHNFPQVLKTLNKEERNQYLLPFPNWLARFMKHIHVTPQCFISKLGKNDRLIWDGSFIPEWESTCINMMLDGKTEPPVMYGDALQRHINRIWNSRITFPRKELYLFDDDVKGAFRHSKYYPDVAGAFSFIISNYLLVSLGQTFGSLVSPQN